MEVFILSMYLSRRWFGGRKASDGLRDVDVEGLSRAAKDPSESSEAPVSLVLPTSYHVNIFHTPTAVELMKRHIRCSPDI
jgi:hypothetical protein